MVDNQVGNRPEVSPSDHDRCAECGRPVREGWVSYRQDPDDPETLRQHFGGIIRSGPKEPREDIPRRNPREIRYPEDLGVFFHSACAPKVTLPEQLQHDIAKLLADAIVTNYRKTLERWAQVRRPASGEAAPPRFHAHVATVQGRRVFTMTRGDWVGFRTHERKLVEIDVERAPVGGVEESASMIAGHAAECSVHTERIEVWRYNADDQPAPYNVHEYLVLENLTRRVNMWKFAERASIQDSPKLRKHLREHVFVVKERPDKGRWEAKARALDRLVFLSADAERGEPRRRGPGRNRGAASSKTVIFPGET